MSILGCRPDYPGPLLPFRTFPIASALTGTDLACHSTAAGQSGGVNVVFLVFRRLPGTWNKVDQSIHRLLLREASYNLDKIKAFD